MNEVNTIGKSMAVIFCALIAVNCQAGLILELSPFQQVSGPEVMLKDIVKDPSTLPDMWKERQVMKAPSSDTSIEYGIASVASALQKYPDMQDVTLKGMVTMSITRSGPVVGLDKIEKAVREYISNNEPWKGQKVEIRCDKLTEKISIPDNDPVIEVTRFTPQNHANKYTFTTAISAEGALKQTISVNATITPMIEVWVARRAINRSEQIIPGENVEPQFMSNDSSGSYVPVSDTIDGMEMNCAVSPNQPISRHSLIQPVCSQNGDQLTVNAERGTLKVMLRAKSLSNGRKGERIMCMNEQSKRRLLVRLTGPREATLDF